MSEKTHSVTLYGEHAPSALLVWHEATDLPFGVEAAARQAMASTVKQYGPECFRQTGAVEYYIKVPEVGMVFIVVQSVKGQPQVQIHASRHRDKMYQLFEAFRAAHT